MPQAGAPPAAGCYPYEHRTRSRWRPAPVWRPSMPAIESRSRGSYRGGAGPAAAAMCAPRAAVAPPQAPSRPGRYYFGGLPARLAAGAAAFPAVCAGGAFFAGVLLAADGTASASAVRSTTESSPTEAVADVGVGGPAVPLPDSAAAWAPTRGSTLNVTRALSFAPLDLITSASAVPGPSPPTDVGLPHVDRAGRSRPAAQHSTPFDHRMLPRRSTLERAQGKERLTHQRITTTPRKVPQWPCFRSASPPTPCMASSQRPSRRMGRRSQGVILCRIQPRSVIIPIRNRAFGQPPADDTLKACAGDHAGHPGRVPGPAAAARTSPPCSSRVMTRSAPTRQGQRGRPTGMARRRSSQAQPLPSPPRGQEPGGRGSCPRPAASSSWPARRGATKSDGEAAGDEDRP